MAKIKNLSIDIKIGNKEYKFRNLILNKLLNSYAKSLIEEYNKGWCNMDTCCIKFSPLDINENLDLTSSDFDICIFNTSKNATINNTSVTIKNVCSTENTFVYDYNEGAPRENLNYYAGKKIYVLGFTFTFAPGAGINAILDVSNYDITIYENEILVITRIDEISSDSIFTSLSEKVFGLVHLAPDGIDGILPPQELWNEDHTLCTIIYYNAYAKLEKVSFANEIGEHELEVDIGSNYAVLNNIFTIKNVLCPKVIFPNSNLFPSSELYTLAQYYKYINLHFKLYQKVAEGTYDDYELVETYTGAEYIQSIPIEDIEKDGNLEIKIKYERGE